MLTHEKPYLFAILLSPYQLRHLCTEHPRCKTNDTQLDNDARNSGMKRLNLGQSATVPRAFNDVKLF